MGERPFAEEDSLHEECGVFGVYGAPEAAARVALGLHALQHRGQEAAGIVSFEGNQCYAHRAIGLVGDNFNSADIIGRLKGDMAIGHNRYSTTGDAGLRNVQPLFGDFSFGGLAVAHNGNLTNAMTLRKELIARGCLFQSTSDTETIIHLIALSREQTVEKRLIDALKQVEGAYSLVVMARGQMIGVRDPFGVRPLVLGRLNDAYVLASETCGLDIIGAEYVRDVAAGEMVVISAEGMRSLHPFSPVPPRFCIFEYVYFARPDSVCENRNVYETRQAIGAELAHEAPAPGDVVVPVPDSGIPAALGYAKASGIPFDLGIIRNHYVGRTFIEPSDQVRHLGVKLKHNGNRAVLAGKRVVLVDDSIVRGTTSKKIVAMVREAGAAEVHMRIASPPTTHSCFYGVDTPTRDQLLAAQNDVAAMAKLIDADSLAFLSIGGLYRAVGEARRVANQPQFCDACFTGEYPIALTDAENTMTGSQKDLFLRVAEV
ncbi:MAG: amidophosphoribosyltransferase [Alphaproteobacteria bacterium]|nr:amidophosphoribosyltransferase [Alphaproteobacteria bacterium]